MNAFVYHAHDREGRMLAALVKHCDADGRFEILPVETTASVARMRRFLARTAGDAEPPFVVLVDGERRSVLYGEPFRRWCGGLVEAFCGDADSTPARTLAELVAPHFAEHSLALLRYALLPPPPPAADVAAGADVDADADAPAGADATPRSAPRVTFVDADVDVDAFDADPGAPVTVAVTPVQSSVTARKTVNISEIMQESKKREVMQQRTAANGAAW